MRKKLIAGNWKMNKTSDEASSMVKELKKLVKDVTDKDILVCPPFTALSSVAKIAADSNIAVGAQNMHFEDNGAFTGEVSGLMIKEICPYVIIGHSERRAYFGEDNIVINKKVKKALEHGLLPIVCVGEKLNEREAGKTEAMVLDHVKGALAGVSKAEIANVVIAYEPVWAIGTGKNATPEQAVLVHKFIRSLLSKMYDAKTASKIRILYGGSVKSSNSAELLSKEDIDGALVGGASLDALEFSKIIKNG